MEVDGTLNKLLDGIPGPVGSGIEFNERQLFIAATRDNAVWRVPLSTEGSTRAGCFIRLSAGNGRWDSRLTVTITLCGARRFGAAWQFDRAAKPNTASIPRGDWTGAIARHPLHPNEVIRGGGADGCNFEGGDADVPTR